MRLTVQIKRANDGHLELEVEEIPQLSLTAKNLQEIPDVVKAAAAEWTGRPADEFTIIADY